VIDQRPRGTVPQALHKTGRSHGGYRTVLVQHAKHGVGLLPRLR